MWIAHMVNKKGVSPTELGRTLAISKSVIQKYAGAARKGLTLHKSGGRPTIFDSPAQKLIVDELGGEKRIQLSTDEVDNVYKINLQDTALRRNKAACQQKPPDKRTIANFEKKLGIKDYACEETSDARADACANIRNTVSTVVQFNSANQLCSHSALHLNFDATQYSVGDKATKGAKKSRCKMIGKVQGNKSKKTRKSKGKKGQVGYFVKQYVGIQPTGTVAPLVYCLADNNMTDGTIDVHEVEPGLLGLNSLDKSNVVFAKDRSMNSAFYQWFWRKVLIPHSVEVRKQYHLEDKLFSVNCDGEDTQIDSFSDEEFFKEVTAANIMVDKPSASTTEITQACDQDIFMEGKKEAAKLTDDDIETEGLPFTTMTRILAEHQTRISKTMPAPHVRMAAFGVCRVQMASQNAYTAPRNKKCFKRIGQYPFNAKVVLSHCTTKLSSAQETVILTSYPALTTQYDEWGTLTAADFDAKGIANNDKENAKPKEDGATCRMRSVRLTNPKQHDKMANKAPAKAERKVKRKLAKERKETGLKEGTFVVKAYKPKSKEK